MACTNPNIGKMIDDYLEGKLSKQDAKKFKNHFLECDECFEKVDFDLTLVNIADNRRKRTKK